MFNPLGTSLQTSNLYIKHSYTKLVMITPFNKSFSVLPKHNLLNSFKSDFLNIPSFTINFSAMTERFFVFKHFRYDNHFWFYIFVYGFYNPKWVSGFLDYFFSYTLFTKTFEKKTSKNFFFFSKKLLRENFIAFSLLKKKKQ